MFQDYYRDRAPEFLGREFGPQFALAVGKLASGWQGPIESGFGWHLVFVDTVIPGRVPEFEEVEPDVKTAWLAEQKAPAWESRTRRCGRSTRCYCRRRLSETLLTGGNRGNRGGRNLAALLRYLCFLLLRILSHASVV